MTWVDFCRSALVLIIVSYLTLVGKQAVMVSPQGRKETAPEPFLDELLKLSGNAARSGASLLDGTLSLRYCTVDFARRVPTWKLPIPGDVALLFCDAVDGVGLEGASEMPRMLSNWVESDGGGERNCQQREPTSFWFIVLWSQGQELVFTVLHAHAVVDTHTHKTLSKTTTTPTTSTPQQHHNNTTTPIPQQQKQQPSLPTRALLLLCPM